MEKLTSEFTVAVHGLVYLCHHKDAVYSSEALAENVCTNAARIRKIMGKLRKAGLIERKEGVDGGYLFVKEGTEVKLSMVADALGVSFVSTSWKSGDPHMECLIASGMADVLVEIYQRLNLLCYENLKGITIADIKQKLLNKKED